MVLCLVTAVAAAGIAAQEPVRRTRWWRAADMQRQLQLTPGQVQRLDRIFEQDLSERIAMSGKIAEKDRELQQVIDRGEADDATVMRLSAKVEDLRRQQNIRRTLMLLAMRRILTPEQRTKLTATRQAAPSPAAR